MLFRIIGSLQDAFLQYKTQKSCLQASVLAAGVLLLKDYLPANCWSWLAEINASDIWVQLFLVSAFVGVCCFCVLLTQKIWKKIKINQAALWK